MHLVLILNLEKNTFSKCQKILITAKSNISVVADVRSF